MIIVLIIQSDLYLFYAILVVSRQISSPIRGHYSLALSFQIPFFPIPQTGHKQFKVFSSFCFYSSRARNREPFYPPNE